jgi:hypothetical protein
MYLLDIYFDIDGYPDLRTLMIVPTEDARQTLETHIRECLESKVNLFYISNLHRFRKACGGSYRFETKNKLEDDHWYESSTAYPIDSILDFEFGEVSVFNADLCSKE